MPTFRWMDTDSGAAKTSRWNTAAEGAAPREAWYCASWTERTELTGDVLEDLRQRFWPGVEATFDETLTINGVPLLRLTLPKQFVPHFVTDDKTFYLYKAASALTVVDFGRLWGGPVAETIRRASPMTMMGDVRAAVALHETPAPRGVLRAEQERVEASRLDPITAEVEPIPERPSYRIVERMHGFGPLPSESRVYEGFRPSNPTCVPEADAASDASSSSALSDALAPFGTDDDADEDVPPVPMATEENGARDKPAAPPVDSRHLALMILSTACGFAAIVAIAYFVLSLD